jgi:hypothetical protein
LSLLYFYNEVIFNVLKKLFLENLNIFNRVNCFYFFQDVFYSRKNFKRPDLQKNPHRSFEKEVAFLDSFFVNGELESIKPINRFYHLNKKVEATLSDI